MAKWIQGLLIALLAVFVTGTFAFAGSSASPSPQEDAGEAIAPGWLGIAIIDINERVVDHFNLTVDSGVAILRVADDGLGGTAGLQVGDVILAIDGVGVTTIDQVIATIRATAPGTTVTITVLRDGAEMDIPVVVGEHPKPRGNKSPALRYLQRLLTPALLKNLIHADYELLGKDGQVVTVGLTLGKVKETTDSGLLTITRRDDVDAQFQTATDTYITIGRHPIKLVGFIEGTTVLVVEKDGEVAAVVGGLRELLKRHQPKQHRARPHQATPPAHAFPRNELGKRLRELAPGPEARKQLRRLAPHLGPELSEQLERYREFLRDPFAFPEQDTTTSAPEPAPQRDDAVVTA